MNTDRSLQEKYVSFKKKLALFGLQVLICTIYFVDYYWYKWVINPYFSGEYKLSNYMPNTTSTFLDIVSKNRNVVFIKNGANFDSLVKVTCIQFYAQLVSFTVFFLDKYLVVLSLKKNTESFLNSTSGLFNKLKRSATSLFAFFWYIFLLFVVFTILI